jgi:CHAT domain-containing protein/Tfp pilus assembly protein PilF
MRWAWAFALVLIGCGAKTKQSPLPSYAHALDLLKSEHLAEASKETESALAHPANSVEYWNLRLLRVQILLAQRESKRVLEALNFTPPSDPEFAEQAARYELCQAHAALLSEHYEAMREHLEKAQTLAPLSDQELIAEIELRRGSLANALRNPGEAQKHLARVLEYSKAHDDHWLGMSATGNMGYFLLRSSKYDEAIPWFEQTLAQARALGASTSIARALGNLGVCYFRLGDLDKAIQNFQVAASHFQSDGNRFELQIWLGSIGNIQESKREYDSAAASYSRALALSRELDSKSNSAAWLNNLAVVSIEQENWDAAERYNDEAIELKRITQDSAAQAYSLVNAGRISLGRGKPSEAEQAFKRALQRPREDLTNLLDAHAGLAEAYGQQGHDRPAEAEFQKAIQVVARQQAALLDEQNKLTWFSSLIRFYQEYVDFLMDRGQTRAALEVVESSRGHVLAERLGESGLRGRTPAANLQRMASLTGSTLLTYWMGQQKSRAWAVSGNEIREFDLPGESELRRLVNAFGSSVQQLDDPIAEGNRAGRTLYDALIAPAAVKTRRVFVAPDGPLCSLNFSTLPVSTGTPRYWIEDVQVSVAPSFELPAQARFIGSPSLLLIGNPVAASADYPELAFAAQEMSGIEKSLPAVREVVYSRGEARPAAYTAANPGRFSWIHFVAHATASPDAPLQSAVILSPDHGADYRLFARNVVQVPLHADLVTISACHSAGARVFAGEGLVGFSWAFLKSGARNVIAGLWDVNDRSTAEMMANLYKELGQGARPAEALRGAQLAMVRSKTVFRKPYYWGPFEVFQAGVE